MLSLGSCTPGAVFRDFQACESPGRLTPAIDPALRIGRRGHVHAGYGVLQNDQFPRASGGRAFGCGGFRDERIAGDGA